MIENLKNMLEFPNLLCSQNAVTAVGNLLVAIHKMSTQTQVDNEKQLIQIGTIMYSLLSIVITHVFVDCNRIRSFIDGSYS
jgi:hypothetical protein